MDDGMLDEIWEQIEKDNIEFFNINWNDPSFYCKKCGRFQFNQEHKNCIFCGNYVGPVTLCDVFYL